MEFEMLCIYGMSLKYPKGWWLYPDKRVFSPKEGRIAIRPQDKEISVVIMWYDLEEEKERTLEKYTKDVICEFQKHFLDLQVLDEHQEKNKEDERFFLHVRYSVKVKRFSKKKKIYERQHHFIKCNKSGKFIIFYITTTPEVFTQERNVIEKMIESFRCH